jgi:hypothetical protein
MANYRVTKYDPALRLSNGTYSKLEWTSVSDIGRTYDGRIFDWAEYVRVEDRYVETVLLFLESSAVRSLRVVDLQRHNYRSETLPTSPSGAAIAQLALLSDGIEVAGPDLVWVIRLALREVIWCRLEGSNGVYVHFGYDYYMYLGSEETDVALPPSLPPGMFAEVFGSPYHEEKLERS